VISRIARNPFARMAIVLPPAIVIAVLLWWRGPDWNRAADAFTVVSWEWVAAAIALNLLSVVARSLSWRTVINQAVPRPPPRFVLVFSAFCVGLLANAVLPGRIGELARVAVLARRMPQRRTLWPTLVGTVFAHRLFDLVPSCLLVVYVLATAKIPHWALISLVLVAIVGAVLVGAAILLARHRHRSVLEGHGNVREVLEMAREGLAVMHKPGAAAVASLFQCLGWLLQLFAVWAVMQAFHLDLPLPAAGLVLVLMNVATIFPLWPGNVGLLQAAIAGPLLNYGVRGVQGFAFGIGLQTIEASVGVGIGLIFLAREGLSFATLRTMPSPEEEAAAAEDLERDLEEEEHARARVPG
jgi:uncharacterized protein (TIRG00374 family)